ncbi:MAG: hypothetical protein A3E07_03615 [Candidatus Wildermuthbacteria bacterium RIFCSPHIGHO2_12_FULL_45_9]|uniref:MBL fold hydrolase n=1 Tax=Candidatus Wildermuthbacteria bacterium RIFCSPHIGHO2_02_FULL_45_25 TaxID=1802450 RepID=A0A1G2R754_9BACT|nr:MAG: hypothetical protein A2748_03250 [Candidatus Wildermuthbacteria bacterium RIFCSPHIGHO2_01_FULL_45_20]OHA67931.1 MAG: hypothetical protein A3C04_04645 [Candidatus Wildermuthbacteria bacterium RIFCSPHIGHO2_02_FULL_45_25]OHA72295.1 MAG: hypothetical protein A3E07_03615 [Candidatus Wildermuthbacteria bacterium RIFCSPHIGHO2_12_FULL_45_9]
MATLTFHGGARKVTGANYLVEDQGTKILIDCGLPQEHEDKSNNELEEFPYNPKDIDAVFITHAHIDHTGRIPQLYKAGFRGVIYSTAPTKDFAEELLIDSEGIMRQEAEQQGKTPLYNLDDIHNILHLWQKVGYHEVINVKGFQVEFFDAGHILGSAFILVTTPRAKRVVFSGDLGNMPNPLLKDTEHIPDADYVLIESTYGGRLHENEQQRRTILKQAIRETIHRKSVLLIPAFAMERTQQLLYEINELKEHEHLSPFPVYMDSPLAIRLTEIYQRYSKDPQYFDPQTIAHIQSGDSIFDFPGLHITRTSRQSKEINKKPNPKVILAGSGMSEGGRVLHHEERYLAEPKNILLFVGYQAKDTLGRHIQDGAALVQIFNTKVPIRCARKSISGYSAHADQRELLNWIQPLKGSNTTCFIVQGEIEQAQALSEKISQEFHIQNSIPEQGETVEL